MENPYEPPKVLEEPLPPPPLPDEHVKPWGALWSLLWAFVVFCIWSVAQAFSAMVALFIDGGSQAFKGDELEKNLKMIGRDGDVAGAITFISGLVGLIMIIAIVNVRGTNLALGLDWKPPRRWWMFPISLVATYLLMIVMGLILKPFQKSDEVDPFMTEMITSTNWIPLLLLGVAVAAPIFEEFLFRGLLQSGLRQSFLGRWGAILVIAVLFSGIHSQYQEPVAFVMLFALGVAFGIARELTGSLWVPIAMHSLNNLLATAGTFYLQEQSLKGGVEALAGWGF